MGQTLSAAPSQGMVANNVTSGSGPFLAADGSAAAPSYSFASSTGSGMFFVTAAGLQWTVGGSARLHLDTSRLRTIQRIAWSTGVTTADDTCLDRNAAGILDLHNTTTTSAQFNVMGTRTSASAYEALTFKWTAINGIATIGTTAAGGGTARALELLNGSATAGVSVQAGTGTGRGRIVGTLDMNVTAVGNVGTGTDDLISYTIPANTFSGDGRAVRITAWGTTANNADGKTVTFVVGSQTVLTTALTVSIAGQWEIVVYIVRTGSNTQDIRARLLQGATVIYDQELTAGTQTDSGTIAVKCTGAATSNNDIVQEGMHTEIIN